MKPSLQLRQIRATLALLASQVEGLEEELREAALPCEHPERERDASVKTFGEPDRWMCRRCGHIGGEKAAKE